MSRRLFRFITVFSSLYAMLYAVEIIDKPVLFEKQRMALTKRYIQTHYGIETDNIRIQPRMIVIHYTANNDLNASFNYLYPETLSTQRTDISAAGALNVSAHFLVDRDGTIYRLMRETFMARHVIGLNYCSIGIENVGGENARMNLTEAQVEANAALVRYLQNKYPEIHYVIGHYEYRRFEKHPLWLEKNPHYRTEKTDPGERFMKALRERLRD